MDGRENDRGPARTGDTRDATHTVTDSSEAPERRTDDFEFDETSRFHWLPEACGVEHVFRWGGFLPRGVTPYGVEAASSATWASACHDERHGRRPLLHEVRPCWHRRRRCC